MAEKFQINIITSVPLKFESVNAIALLILVKQYNSVPPQLSYTVSPTFVLPELLTINEPEAGQVNFIQYP